MAKMQVGSKPHLLVVTSHLSPPEHPSPPKHPSTPEQLSSPETEKTSLTSFLARLKDRGYNVSVLGAASAITWSDLEVLHDPTDTTPIVLFELALEIVRINGTSPGSPASPSPSADAVQDLANTIRQLRYVPELRAVPVIAVGPQTKIHVWQAAIRAGALEYLPYTAGEEEFMQTFEQASARQEAFVAEVQRQVEERYHDIIGIIQHEFRTPMTLLLGYGEYLRETLDGTLDKEELALSVEAILSGSHRLNRLIESFLLLSDLQYRQPDALPIQNIVPEMLWREVHAILRAEVEESGLEIQYADMESLPVTAADPELLREALSRLLDNALHHMRPQSQHITLSVSGDDSHIEWSIKDEGIGIEPNQVIRILEPFGRAQGNRYIPQSVGLSLAIVKRIAELHHGELLVESRLGEGSRFTLRIPLKQL